MVDKISITIIAFVAVFAISAGLLATNSIPAIFNTGSIANDTKYETINQTAILQKFVKLYLANTLNDTKENTQALASAKQSLENQEQSLRNQQQILNENTNITQDILEISQEHKSAAKSHDVLSKKGDDLIEKIDNITQLSYELLERHAKNVSQALVEEEEEREEKDIDQNGSR